MIKLTSRQGIRLPTIYLVQNNQDLKRIPPGISWIRGNPEDEESITQTFEFHILLQAAFKSGIPFNWNKLLKENGFEETYTKFIAHSTKPANIDAKDLDINEADLTQVSIGDCVIKMDSSYVVDLEVLEQINIVPAWFKTIRERVARDIRNSARFNPLSYNKKLGICNGDIKIASPEKNLIIIDLSKSIPKSITTAICALAKTMSINYYADVMLTGGKTIMFDYNKVSELDFEKIYKEIGGRQEAKNYRELVKTSKKYDTVICFGDNNSPLDSWSDNLKNISQKQAFEICNWKVNNIISLHTHSNTDLAQYASFFEAPVTHIKDWVKDLNNN